MKNTLMFLLASLLLAFCLTACGGGQTTGNVDDYGSTGQSGSGSVNEGGVVGGGSTAGNGSTQSGAAGDGLMDGARDAVDDAGRSVRGTLDDAGYAIDRAF